MMPLSSYLFERTFGFRLQSDLLLFSYFTRVLSFGDQFSGIIATRASIGKVDCRIHTRRDHFGLTDIAIEEPPAFASIRFYKQ